MADLLTGVFTSKGREVIAKGIGNVAGYPSVRAKYFKIGMGGYFTTGGGRSPKDPDPSLTDIEADGTPGNAFFRKDFSPVDFTFIAPSTMQIRCRLEPSEANDDGNSEAPRFFEIGIFDDDDNMIIYTTFAEQSKAPNKILSNFVQAYF